MRTSHCHPLRGLGTTLLFVLCSILIGSLWMQKALAAPAAAPAAAPDPDLAGRWLLDSERSDSPERASRRALRDVQRVLEPRGQATQPSSRPAAERARSVLAPLTPPREHVHIDLGEGEAIFRFDGEAPRRHYTDGRSGITDSARPQVGFAAWEDGRLYVEQAFDGGTRIVETWWVEADRLRAHYEVRNSLFREPVRFTLQFQREVRNG